MDSSPADIEREPATRTPLSPKVAWWVLFAGLALEFVLSTWAPTVVPHPHVLIPALSLDRCVALMACLLLLGALGVWRNRPRPRWPWVLTLLSTLSVPAAVLFQNYVAANVEPVDFLPYGGYATQPRPQANWRRELHEWSVSLVGKRFTFALNGWELRIIHFAWLVPVIGAIAFAFAAQRLLAADRPSRGRALGELAMFALVAGLLGQSLLVNPADRGHRLVDLSLIGLPIVDLAAAIAIVLALATAVRRPPALALYFAATLANLAGAILFWYATNSNDQFGYRTAVPDTALYPAALACFGAAAVCFAASMLHPSVTDVTKPRTYDDLRSGLRYQLVVGMGVCLAVAMVILQPLGNPWARGAVCSALILLIAVVVYRGWRAISAQALADRRARDLNDDLRATLDRLARAEDDERRRVARDLHDTVVQDLVALRWEFAELADRPDDSGARAELDALSERLSEITSTARSVSHRLQAPVYDAISLDTAVRFEVVATRSPRLSIDLRSDVDAELSESVAAITFRTMREALRNVVRHADATNASVTLKTTDDALTVEVRDDGVGIDGDVLDAQLRVGHIGVASMRDSVTEAGGTFIIAAGEGRGTVVRFTLPLASVDSPTQ